LWEINNIEELEHNYKVKNHNSLNDVFINEWWFITE